MRLHVVDGTFELYRAHYAKRPDRRAPDGRDVKATAGLLASMMALLADAGEAVTHLAVAFDNPIRSFRNDLFAGYKSDEGVPPELHAQFGLAEDALRALGVVVWSMQRWEADDAMATAAARFAGEVEQVRLLTPDKDLGQCLDGARVVLVDRIRRRVVDEPALLAARGIAPASVPDWLALVGDTADGIPGLAGFGERSASALLGHFRHVEHIPDDPGRWRDVRGADRLAATLRAGREDALLYRRLATLDRVVPLPEGLDDLRWRGAPRPELGAFCARLGLGELAERAPAPR